MSNTMQKLLAAAFLMAMMAYLSVNSSYSSVGGNAATCTGNYKGSLCEEKADVQNPRCHGSDEIYFEDETTKLSIANNAKSCTGIIYRDCKATETFRPDKSCDVPK